MDFPLTIDASDLPICLQQIEVRLDRIEQLLHELQTCTTRQVTKPYYTVAEFAERVGLSKWTTRNHCRCRRLLATRLMSPTGVGGSWRLPHEELERYTREGLRPRVEATPRARTAS